MENYTISIDIFAINEFFIFEASRNNIRRLKKGIIVGANTKYCHYSFILDFILQKCSLKFSAEGFFSQDLGQCHWIMFTKNLQCFTFNIIFTLCFWLSWTIRYLLTSLIQNVVPRAKISHTNLSWLFYGKIRNLLSSLFSAMLLFAFVQKYCPLINKKLKCLILRTVFAEKILRC